MQATTLKEKINLSHAKAIRRFRELLKLTRMEMASRLGISFQTVEKYESGRAIIDEEKLGTILLNGQEVKKNESRSLKLASSEKSTPET